MNTVTIKGKILTQPKILKTKDYLLITFQIGTEESCVNHRTKEPYTRRDVHNIVLWDGLARRWTHLCMGDTVTVQGPLRSRLVPISTWWNSKVVKHRISEIEAFSLKKKRVR